MNKTKIGYRAFGALASAALALTSISAPAQISKSQPVAAAPVPAQEEVSGSTQGRSGGLPPGILVALTVAAGAGLIVAIAAITRNRARRSVSP